MSATRKRKPIATGSDWNFSVLERFDAELARLADEYRLDTYPNQIEVITTEQMMDAYASVGMPVGYHHWSFGKQFLAVEQAYKRGQRKSNWYLCATIRLLGKSVRRSFSTRVKPAARLFPVR